MDEAGRRSEFATFVSGLPPQMEVALMTDTVATAFARARAAGHSAEALLWDAQARVRRNGGIGVLVTALRTLADNPPLQRVGREPALGTPMSTITRMPAGHGFVADEHGRSCLRCQLPPVNRTHAGYQSIPYHPVSDSTQERES